MVSKEDIAALYIALFSRAPEGEALDNWFAASIENNWGIAELSESMLLAAQQVVSSNPEYQKIYPQYINVDSTNPESVKAIIETVYKTLFDKTYQDDPEGINGWVNNVVYNGQPIGEAIASIEIVAKKMALGEIPADEKTLLAAKTFLNRIDAALYVAEKIYKFDGDFTKFQNFILQVTDDPQSIENIVSLLNNTDNTNTDNTNTDNTNTNNTNTDNTNININNTNIDNTNTNTNIDNTNTDNTNTDNTNTNTDNTNIDNTNTDNTNTDNTNIDNTNTDNTNTDNTNTDNTNTDNTNTNTNTDNTNTDNTNIDNTNTDNTNTDNTNTDNTNTDNTNTDNTNTDNTNIDNTNTDNTNTDNTNTDNTNTDNTNYVSFYNEPLILLTPEQEEKVKALIYGTKWNSSIVKYSFPNQLPNEYLDSIARETKYFSSVEYFIENWKPFDETEKNIVYQLFGNLENVINIDFQEVDNLDGYIRFNNVSIDQSYYWGFGYYPSYGLGGDVFIDNNKADTLNDLKNVIIHELGHALGLKHPFDGDFTLPETESNTLYTVMAYDEYKNYKIFIEKEGDSFKAYYTPYAVNETFQIYDILALQALYGANNVSTSGNDIYDLSYLYTESKYYTIWDSNGIDTLDVSKVEGKSIINLNDGSFSSIDYHSLEDIRKDIYTELVSLGMSDYSASNWSQDLVYTNYSDTLYTGENNLAIAYGTIIENVKTGNGNDIISDNEADNNIYSGNGDDVINLLYGGSDFVDGGDGYDKVFLNDNSSNYKVISESTGTYTVINSLTGEKDILVNIEELVFEDTNLIL